MNRAIRKVAIAIAVLFLALFVNLNVVQVWHGDSYRNNAGNARVHYDEYSSPRGAITVNGRNVAESVLHVSDPLKYLRKYPTKHPEAYASVTGYFPFNGSATQLESSENSILSGDSDRLFTTKLADILTGRGLRGGSIQLTLSPAAQSAAYEAMKDAAGKIRAGAVVAVDPTTGAILAAVSTPSYDPNVLSSHHLDQAAHALGCYQALDFPRQGRHESLTALRARTGQAIRAQLVLRESGSTGFLQRYLNDPAHVPLGGLVYATPATDPSTQTVTWTPFVAYDNLTAARGTSSAIDRRLRSAYTAAFRAHGLDFDPDAGLYAHGVSGCGDVPDDPTPVFAADHQAPSPLINKGFYERYFAGSIFKIVDSAAALEHGVQPDSTIPAPNGYRPFDPTDTAACPSSLNTACIENFGGEQCDNGKTASLVLAFAKSCNTAFAQLAVERLGATALINQAQRFGFGTTDQFAKLPPPYAASTIGDQHQLNTDPAYLAQSAFGQRDVQVTPLLAALMSAAVANNGTMMKPYLVKEEQRPDLTSLDTTQPEQFRQVMDASDAPLLQQMMEQVVTSPAGTGGTANITDIPGVQVGGKTGTADTGLTSASKVQPDAWFTGFAMYRQQPKIAVAVLLEHAGVAGNEVTGGKAAGPVAKAVMEAYLKSIKLR